MAAGCDNQPPKTAGPQGFGEHFSWAHLRALAEGGLYPDRHRVARYLVDLGRRTLIAEAHDGHDPPFRQRVDVLDDMMATIELTTGP